MLGKFGAAIILASLVGSTMAFAATGQNQALATGKPAGVKAAQAGPGLTLTVVGLAVVAGGIALVASGNEDTKPTATTTTTFVAP
jgi:hypothetical protein